MNEKLVAAAGKLTKSLPVKLNIRKLAPAVCRYNVFVADTLAAQIQNKPLPADRRNHITQAFFAHPSVPENERSHNNMAGAGLQKFFGIVRSYPSADLKPSGISGQRSESLYLISLILLAAPGIQQNNMSARQTAGLIKPGKIISAFLRNIILRNTAVFKTAADYLLDLSVVNVNTRSEFHITLPLCGSPPQAF